MRTQCLARQWEDLQKTWFYQDLCEMTDLSGINDTSSIVPNSVNNERLRESSKARYEKSGGSSYDVDENKGLKTRVLGSSYDVTDNKGT